MPNVGQLELKTKGAYIEVLPPRPVFDFPLMKVCHSTRLLETGVSKGTT